MSDIIIHKVNETFVRLEIDDVDIENNIYKSFSYTSPSLKFHPKVKARLWSGYFHMYDYRTKLFPIGLIEELVKFCQSNNYTFEFTFNKVNNYNEEIYNNCLSFVKDKFKLKDYQEQAIDFALKNNRGIIVSATSSGKSLIMYFLALYYSLLYDNKILIVVTTKDLVTQMYDNFLEYYKGDEEEFSKSLEVIYSNSKRNDKAKIVISTWQSLQNKDKEYFEDFVCVLGDECHQGKATEIKKIIESCINAYHKFGFTGTLSNKDDKQQINEMLLKGLFGKVFNVITTRELIDKEGHPEVIINAVKLSYQDQNLCKLVLKGSEDTLKIKRLYEETSKQELLAKYKKKVFDEELEIVYNNTLRNNYIKELACSLEGNTLIMFQHIDKHGDKLYQCLKDSNKQVFYIHGNVKDRDTFKEVIESSNGVIAITSYGTTSTGIDFKNVHNIILASGYKASIKMLQTIGRGLRKHDSKNCINIFDLCDDFTMGKNHQNYLYKHFMKRIELYKDEQFIIKTKEITL